MKMTMMKIPILVGLIFIFRYFFFFSPCKNLMPPVKKYNQSFVTLAEKISWVSLGILGIQEQQKLKKNIDITDDMNLTLLE